MKHVLTVLLFLLPKVASAQDHWEVVEPYFAEDVVAVAYLDLSKVDTIGLLEWVEELGFGPDEGQRKPGMDLMLNIQQRLDETCDFGARYVYVLFRVSDLQYGGPTWVIPIEQEGNARAVLELLLGGTPIELKSVRDSRPPFFPEHCTVHNSSVLGANTGKQLVLQKTNQSKQNRDMSAAWNTLGRGDCGLIVCGDQDSRRVVRELFPKLPSPFDSIDGRLIADHLQWAGISANLPPKTSLQFVIQAEGEAAAQELLQAARGGLALLRKLPLGPLELSSRDRDQILSLIEPKVVDDRLEISFDGLLGDVDKLVRLLTPPVKVARQQVQRQARMKKFKEIALGILNYESARGSFPPRASHSEGGKPLLSWRVHILPYMNRMDLYNQFHLDEPWDSKHNKQLIPLMPEIYADPDPSMARRNSQGRTSFVVPTGPGTLYEGAEPPMYKDIKDGSSNTILLVEVISHATPIWTRPKDWSPSKIPYEKLRREDRDWITTGYCDGSVSIYPLSTPVGILRELLSPNGGGVVERP